MRRVRNGLLAAVVVAIVLSMGSCTWLISMFNEVEIDGESYQLSKMVVVKGPEDSGGNLGAAFFMSEDVSFGLSTGFSGTGNAVLIMFMSLDGTLAEDDYTFTSDPEIGGLAMGNVLAEAKFVDGAPDTWTVMAYMDDGNMGVRETLDGALAIAGEFSGFDEFDASVDVVLTYRGKVDHTYDDSMALSVLRSELFRSAK